ncbi:hypothetical protein N1851_006562 [Merluccius polli]|uniref:Uncharacterized protein n=1 Tax=Merluccius polli TaxID=89951 RepID=A0AA47PAB6_MERPO|nr:hypothetical protein N1851_006562 [Merluccius polli]
MRAEPIHPSSCCLSGVGSWGQQPKQGSPDFPLPSHFVQLFLGDPEAFPGQPERHSLSSVSWVFPVVSYQWDVNTSPGRRPGGILTRCPSHLIWLLSTRRSSGSTPSSSQMTELLTLSLRESPATLRRKLILAACTRDLLPLHHDGSVQSPHYCRRRTDPPVDLPLHPPLTREQDPEVLELLHLVQDLIPDPESALHPFPPHNIQGLKELWADLIHPRSPATSATSAPEIGEPTPESPGPASLPEGVSVGLRRSLKYSFHRSTTSRVEVSSAPSPPYTVLTMHCFPLPRRRMVVQNLFEAVRRWVSMASPNSSHVRVFASATAAAVLRLACRYLPAASGVPQAKNPIGLLLQFDGIPHRQCPPAGSGIATTAGTDHLAATAPVGALTMEARNMAHMFASPGTWSKLSRRWELKLSLTGDSARRSQQTLTIRLGLPGLTGILPHHRSQLTTRW